MTTPREPREPLDVQPIAERAAQATPGPWRAQDDGVWSPYSTQCNGRYVDDPVYAQPFGGAFAQKQQHKDAQFIAHAREDIPALLAEVARLRGLIAQAEWQAEDGIDHDASCPWCRQFAFLSRHASDCPAFSAPGVPR